MSSSICQNCKERRGRFCRKCVDGMTAPLHIAVRQAAMAKVGEQPAWTPLERAELSDKTDPATATLAFGANPEIWINSRYQVAVRRWPTGPWGPMVHLSVKRWDKQPADDWRDLMLLKDTLVGPETEGVNLLPASSRVVDGANQTHLWIFPKFKFPFGFEGRCVTEEALFNSVQRPFEPHVRPKDLKTKDELMAWYEKQKTFIASRGGGGPI